MLTYPAPEAFMNLRGLHHHFDSERFRWLAQQLRELDSPNVAELCERWAQEHAEMARRERETAAGYRWEPPHPDDEVAF